MHSIPCGLLALVTVVIPAAARAGSIASDYAGAAARIIE